MSDVLTIQVDSADSSLAWASLGERRWRCVIGAGGVREDKVEGDGATPAGAYPLRHLYFRNDRLVLPKVRLPARAIGEHDGWCDDPRSPAYNRLVRIPNEWSHEKMWREDGLYDLLVVTVTQSGQVENRLIDTPVGMPASVLQEASNYLNVHSLSAAEQRPRPRGEDDDDMKQFEDFDEQDW
jgi:hypothetical protein